MLASLEEPNRLIIETCIATGARISEVLGLKWKYVHLDAGTIKIEQRVWQQEVGVPKTENSLRILGLGDLVDRYREKAKCEGAGPDEFVFQQKRAPGKLLWDSGVRAALHQAAQDEGCNFPGLGPHSFRRANSHGAGQMVVGQRALWLSAQGQSVIPNGQVVSTLARQSETQAV